MAKVEPSDEEDAVRCVKALSQALAALLSELALDLAVPTPVPLLLQRIDDDEAESAPGYVAFLADMETLSLLTSRMIEGEEAPRLERVDLDRKSAGALLQFVAGFGMNLPKLPEESAP